VADPFDFRIGDGPRPRTHSEHRAYKSFDKGALASHIHHFFFVAMLGSRLFPGPISSCSPTILQFPAEPTRAVYTLRIMTTQLLQEASQIIPNPQLLINVISKRVRQLGLGHRPMVETGPRASLTDIALKEIIAGKLTFEEQSASADGA
jgi:DNA-directed RNA polymerase subunit omega